MQTGKPEGLAFMDIDVMDVSVFCREGLGGKIRMISDGVYNKET